MRSSDWSSDVCSSDLIALLQALRHRTGRLTDQEVLEAGEGRAVEDRALVVRVLLQALDLFAFDRDRALVLVDAVTVEDADLDDGARHARRQAERSEEHTSELQSLMRISYAVFCLKKKKAAAQEPIKET